MKKVYTTLALCAAFTSAATAENLLINGDFSTDSFVGDQYINPNVDFNAGWQRFGTSWEISGGQILRGSGSAFNPKGFGQSVTSTLTSGTDVRFSFDYTVPESSAVNDLFIATAWGLIDNGTGSTGNSSSNTLNLSGAESVGPAVGGTAGGRFVWTALDTFSIVSGFGSGTYSNDITLGANYDQLAVSFGQDNYHVDAVATIDNVYLGTVPEPSAFALLSGLAALGFMASRRRK